MTEQSDAAPMRRATALPPAEENVKTIKELLGVSEIQAEFISAIETGELDGDAINEDEVDEFKGNPIEDTAEEE